jgi:hypothetical protein
VYPFIEGDTGFTGMTDEQWKEVGTIFHQIHQVTLPPEGFESLQIEAALLRALSNVDLPFRLSLPIRTQSGDSVAFLEQDSKMLAFATLSPFLPGKRPDRNDPSLASPAGTAWQCSIMRSQPCKRKPCMLVLNRHSRMKASCMGTRLYQTLSLL